MIDIAPRDQAVTQAHSLAGHRADFSGVIEAAASLTVWVAGHPWIYGAAIVLAAAWLALEFGGAATSAMARHLRRPASDASTSTSD